MGEQGQLCAVCNGFLRGYEATFKRITGLDEETVVSVRRDVAGAASVVCSAPADLNAHAEQWVQILSTSVLPLWLEAGGFTEVAATLRAGRNLDLQRLVAFERVGASGEYPQPGADAVLEVRASGLGEASNDDAKIALACARKLSPSSRVDIVVRSATAIRDGALSRLGR